MAFQVSDESDSSSELDQHTSTKVDSDNSQQISASRYSPVSNYYDSLMSLNLLSNFKFEFSRHLWKMLATKF